MQILGQQNQVPSNVTLVKMFMLVALCDIDLTTKNGLELVILFFATIYLEAIVMQFLDAKHVAMIGQCHAPHTIGYGFINHPFDRGLSV